MLIWKFHEHGSLCSSYFTQFFMYCAVNTGPAWPTLKNAESMFLTAVGENAPKGLLELALEILEFRIYFWRSVGSENPPTLFTNHITDTMAHVDSVGKVLHLPLCVCAFVCVCIVLWRSTTMLRVFPALWWCNAHCARAPCLQGHMSFLKLWTTPTATATVYYVYWLLSLRHYCQFKDNK